MVKMIALRRVYSRSNGKEFAPGETFHEHDEREARKHERSKRAEKAPHMERPSKVDLPVKRAAMEPETDTPKKSGGRGRYQRRDMIATDGQTGEEIPLPSSLQDPPSEEPTSTNSEAEPEQ